MLTLLLAIAGLVGSFITQLVKKGLKVSGNYAVLVSYIISFGLTIGVAYYAGTITSLNDVIAQSAVIFAASSAVYEIIIKSLGVGEKIDKLIGTEETTE